MFDIGFWELSVIGIIGLLVLGPERLPKVARVIGGYLRKARSTWANVRAEIAAELDAEEFKEAMKKPAEELKSAMAEPMKDFEDLKKSARETVSFDEPKSAKAESAEPDSEPDQPQEKPASAEANAEAVSENSQESGASESTDSVPDKTA